MHIKGFYFSFVKKVSSFLLLFCLVVLSAQAQPLAKHVIFIGLDTILTKCMTFRISK